MRAGIIANNEMQKLIELGYECLMNESTNLIPALARSIPSGNVNSSYKLAMQKYYNDCFAAFNYHAVDAAGAVVPPTNRIAKILQHVRMASTATASPMTVMIVPAGADLNGYQREPDAHFKVRFLFVVSRVGKCANVVAIR